MAEAFTDREVDERFSFVRDKDRMAESDSKYWMDRLRKQVPQWSKDHPLLRALNRGIGMLTLIAMMTM
jgi:hypothetical protein